MTTPYKVWHRRQMCERKRRLPSEHVARNYAWLVELAYGHAMDVYACEYCTDWHLTTLKPGGAGHERAA